MRWNPFRSIEKKQSAAGPNIVSWFLGRPVWTPLRYDDLAKESYLKNVIAYRCSKMISQAASGIGLYLVDRKKEVETHPILELLARPNPTMGGAFFMEAAYTYLMLAGNSYVEGVGRMNDVPSELYPLRPDRMKVVPGPNGFPAQYVHTVNGRDTRWDVRFSNGRNSRSGGLLDSEILHVREFHPTEDFYGLPRVQPGAQAIDRWNAASAHNKSLLDNGVRPSGALVFKPVGTGDDFTMPSSDVMELAEKDLKSRHGGPENAGKPMVFGGAVDWLQMGLSPVDMDFNESKLDAARDICLAWGVPHILVVPGSSTYNNVREAKLELYEQTVLPIVEHMLGELNNWLVRRTGDNLTLEPDLDSVSALEPRREAKRKSVVELVDKGMISSDEARAELGYGARPAGTVQKVDASVVSALVTAMEHAGPEPLLRYLKSVGLYDATMTPEQMAEAALGLDQTEEPDPMDQPQN